MRSDELVAYCERFGDVRKRAGDTRDQEMASEIREIILRGVEEARRS